ncbi:MAG: GUN4 domain-containing protein [Pseudanabaenaceae cyanobacterium]
MNSEEFLLDRMESNGEALKKGLGELIAFVQQLDVPNDPSSALALEGLQISVNVDAEGRWVLATGGALTLHFRLQSSTRAVSSVSEPTAAADDLQRLDGFLTAGSWQAANRETWNVLCQGLGKAPGTPLTPGDIAQLPCELLQKIDRLWRDRSGGKFGFQAQTKVY